MNIKLQEFQEACRSILEAVDESSDDATTEVLELTAKAGKMLLSVKSKEYFVTVSLDTNSDEELHAVISASAFLKLISKITTDTVDLSVANNVLTVKGNGNYKFPLIFDGDRLLELPRIVIDNVTNDFTIANDTLQDILKYNSKELQKSGIKKPAQKMFYIDEQGALTYSAGACITEFTLDTPIRLLLSEKLVKLFKLFSDDTVAVTLGFTSVSQSLTQTKIKFKTSNVELTAITNNDSQLINSVPAKVIRSMANSVYDYKVIFNKQDVLDALGRLSIFAKKDVVTLHTYLEITDSELIIYDTRKENNERVALEQSNLEDTYSCILNTNDFKITLESQKEEFVTMRFGNGRAIVFDRPKIKNILPECREN